MVDSEIDSQTAPGVKLEDRPGVLFVGSPFVGKRTIVHRLLSSSGAVDYGVDDFDSTALLQGWTIDNKYYTAELAVSIAHHLEEKPFRVQSLSYSHRITALVLVFDASNESTFVLIQDWVSENDINQFDILLCVANKVDLIPTHPAHAEYRNKLRFSSFECSFPNANVISNTEVASLLSNDEPEDLSLYIRSSCRQWCADHNFELIEACASNPIFEKCLSVDGDSQGVERIVGALSAHMWPGMIMKSGMKAPRLAIPTSEKPDSSDEDPDYDFEYEVLSEGSAEPYDDTMSGWMTANGNGSTSQGHANEAEHENEDDRSVEKGVTSSAHGGDTEEHGGVTTFDLEDIDIIMSEIGNARDKLRFLPDIERREMAATLAFKMAAMFGGGSDDEEDCA